jgi:hypothetical protein
MIKQCFPLSLKYSPIAQPEYGAKNYNGAASEAVAATIIVYLKASWSFNNLTMLATVDLFYPIAT